MLNFETNSKVKNTRDLYRGISDFKKGYQPRNNTVKVRRVICLQTPTVFWLGGGNISLSFSLYMGLMMLDRNTYNRATSATSSTFEFEMAIEKLKRHKSLGTDQIPAELINP